VHAGTAAVTANRIAGRSFDPARSMHVAGIICNAIVDVKSPGRQAERGMGVPPCYTAS
jgi:hypothetical protein